MIESIDQLRPGEYLMCERGPIISGTDSRGHFVKKQDRSFEGSIVQVLAISPPMMLTRIFPMPCGDPSHDHTPYVTTVRFDHMGWSRPVRRYVREYMRAAKHPEPILRSTPGVAIPKVFNDILEDIYKRGGNPDGPFRDEDEDDDLSPTDI